MVATSLSLDEVARRLRSSWSQGSFQRPRLSIEPEPTPPERMQELLEAETGRQLIRRYVSRLASTLQAVEQLAAMGQSDPTLINRIEQDIRGIESAVGLPLPKPELLEELSSQLSRILPPDEAQVVYAAARGNLSPRAAAEELYRYAVARGVAKRMRIPLEQAQSMVREVIDLGRALEREWRNIMRVLMERHGHFMERLREVEKRISELMHIAKAFYGRSLPRVLRSLAERVAHQHDMREFMVRMAERMGRGESVEQAVSELVRRFAMEFAQRATRPQKLEQVAKEISEKREPVMERGPQVQRELLASISGVKRHVYHKSLSLGGSS